jgi:4-alpha-glucanotransferase
MRIPRSSGILLHPTSLPGPCGIGTFGQAAFDFIDFLEAAGQSYWQILPYGPVSRAFGCSPYMSLSAFAGNPLLIDPGQLAEEGLLGHDCTDCAGHDSSEHLVDFDAVIPRQEKVLRSAFREFQGAGGGSGDFADFCRETDWLDDYALFRSLREEFQLRPWFAWPASLARRDPAVLALWRERLAQQILFHKFVQFCFFSQWRRVRDHASSRGISIIGDIPIYVALDSADVWAGQDCFLLDPATGLPTHVAGVPPDYFSETGQRWGNPLFAWNRDNGLNPGLIAWWIRRFRHIFQAVDVVRIDHFRGFEAFWQIPATEGTAVNGTWVKGPGQAFFAEMGKELGELPIIAEDLGLITPEVEQLRDQLGFPGMKVLQFAFDSDERNIYLPHNYETPNCVVYTGTHDNDTTLGWFFSDRVAQTSKDRALRCCHSSVGSPVHWDFIRLAYSSIAALAVVPMQDVLGFGSDCRMNMPSTSRGNWSWRCAARFLTDEIAVALRDETVFYNRGPAAAERPEHMEG